MIETILVIWLALWVYKNYPSKSVKTYMKKLLGNHKYGFAKLEFDIFALKEEREELRKEVDRLLDTQEAFRLQSENPNNTEDTKETFKKKLEAATKSIDEVKALIDEKDLNVTIYEKQMSDLQSQKQKLEAYIERDL